MLILPSVLEQRRRLKYTPRRIPPAPTALALIEATYDQAVSVTLVFNQPVDLSQIVSDMITVADGAFEGTLFIGEGVPEQPTPETVTVFLAPFDPYQESGVLLTASDGAGIRSVSGEVWEGVDGLVLPFGV
jgi:hypothetical protein